MLCVFCVLCASKSIDNKQNKLLKPPLSRLIVDENVSTTEKSRKCEEVPEIILAELLGEAYNSRYMSVNRPLTDDEVDLNANDRNAYTVHKRKVENLPSFYVEESHSIELSEKPAWDIRGHIENLESQLGVNRRRKRAISIINDPTNAKPENVTRVDTDTDTDNDSLTTRNKRAYGRHGAMSYDGQRSKDNNKNLYPWKCDASIKWVDLGPDYFPRFLRSVECEEHFCWYKMFVCKPKSFAVKVLHRRRGVCADAANLRKISAFEFRGEFGELWKWEEVAVNFCCDCAVAHPARKFA